MNLPLAAFIGHMSGADFFGLVVLRPDGDERIAAPSSRSRALAA